jgi:hypothetical protein
MVGESEAILVYCIGVNGVCVNVKGERDMNCMNESTSNNH